MEKQFVTYEIALKIKELGFDEECYGVFVQEKGNVLVPISNIYYTGCALLKHIKAPLWQQTIDWFREKYNYHISVFRLNGKWCGEVYDILRQCYVTSNAFDKVLFDNYEVAREKAILNAIELCKN